MANGKKTWSETYGDKSATLTPLEWEQKTGNKLLSYSTYNGNLALDMPMKYQARPTSEFGPINLQPNQLIGFSLPGGFTLPGSYNNQIINRPSSESSNIRKMPSINQQEIKNPPSYEKYGISPQINMPMSYSDYKIDDSNKGKENERSSSLLESAYKQVMGRYSGESSDSDSKFNNFGGSLYNIGKIPSMASLEAASKRLADAALFREMLSAEYKGSQELGLQKLRGAQDIGLQRLRGEQDIGLQRLRGEQDIGLQGLRGSQESNLQGLRGSQEYKLQGLRGSQESNLQSERQKSERNLEIEREIRELQREAAEVGSQPYTPSNSSRWNSLNQQIINLKKQIR